MKTRMHVRNLLILELGGIGDAVMSLPAIEAALTVYRDGFATILTVPRTRPIIESLRRKGFNNFEAMATDAIEKGDLVEWIDLLRAIRSRRFDTVIDLSAVETNKAAVKRYLFLKILGIREILGRDTEGRGWAFTKKSPETLISPEHEVERKMDVVRLLCLETKTAAPGIIVSRSEREKAAAFLSDWIQSKRLVAGLNPGAFRPSRMWPEERFKEIAQWLIEDLSMAVVVTGGAKERVVVNSITKSFPGDSIKAAIDLPITELSAIVERLDIYIANDTGPMHIAAALNVPIVAIFGQTNIYRYHPYMDDSRYVVLKGDSAVCPYISFEHPMQECRRYDCEGKDCIKNITVEEVKMAAQQMLAKHYQRGIDVGD